MPAINQVKKYFPLKRLHDKVILYSFSFYFLAFLFRKSGMLANTAIFGSDGLHNKTQGEVCPLVMCKKSDREIAFFYFKKLTGG